jgi:hypothetical protein
MTLTSFFPAVMKFCLPEICSNHIVSDDVFLHYSLCFGSGFAWIRIDLALLGPNPDPYWEFGSGSRSKEFDQKLAIKPYFQPFKMAFVRVLT